MKAIVGTHCTNDYSQCPDFFVFNVSVETIENIERLSRMCVGGIIRISAESSDGQWVDFGADSDLYGHHLVVEKDHFWFQVYQDNQSGHIESSPLSLESLKADLQADLDVVFYGDDQVHLEKAYAESLAAA